MTSLDDEIPGYAKIEDLQPPSESTEQHKDHTAKYDVILKICRLHQGLHFGCWVFPIGSITIALVR